MPAILRYAALSLITAAVTQAQICVDDLPAVSIGTGSSPAPANSWRSIAMDQDLAFVGRAQNPQWGLHYAGQIKGLRRVGGTWVVLGTMHAPSPCTGETFGASLALDAHVLAVGTGGGMAVAGGSPPFCPIKGSVYLYDVAGPGPILLQTLHGVAAAKDFGGSIDLDGDLLVVGDRYDATGGPIRGRGHVYRRVAGTWTLEQELIEPEVQAQDEYGACTAVSGDTVAVSAPYLETAAGVGAIYLYRWSGTAWALEQRIDPSSPYATGGVFALDGARLIVPMAGPQAEVYERTGTTWVAQGTLDLSSAFAYAVQSYVRSVDLEGDRALFGLDTVVFGGGFGKQLGHGYAQIWGLGPGGWNAQHEWPIDLSVEFDEYGYSVALSGDHLMVRQPHTLSGDLVRASQLPPAPADLGPGLAGSGGIAPALQVSGCMIGGGQLGLQVLQGLAGAVGVVAIGTPGALPIPYAGGTLWAFPWLVILPHVLGGPPGTPGAGAHALFVNLPPTLPAGISLALQAGYLDPGAAQGISLSNAVLVQTP